MKKLYGITVAMPTPFNDQDQVNYSAVKSFTSMLIEKGVNCLYPCGTTGEMLRLTVDERKKIAETVVKEADHRVPVFIHSGAMRMDDTIALAEHAESIGADGVGIVTPQFFGVNDREMEEFYVEVANSVSENFPIYLYNIPQCSCNDLKATVAAKIAQRCRNVVGIKYSFLDMSRTLEYLQIRNGSFDVLHGCDKLLLSMLDIGCVGTVSGCSSAFPEPFVAEYKCYVEGDIEGARKWAKICVKFVNALKAGSNMAYFKEALTARGLVFGNMRKPQLNLLPEENEKLVKELKALCDEAQINFSL